RLGADAIPVGGMVGRPGLLLAEACEFNRSFHNLRPTIASIASVEADHLDIYGSLDAVVEAFHGFASLVPSAEDGGLLLIAEEGAHRREVTAGLSCDVQTIGFSPAADWVVWLDPEQRHVVLTFRRERVCEWNMQLPGAHNAMNAATAAALAISAGADADVVGRSLSAFRGVDRRTQYLGERQLPSGPVRVWDDYGHHPTEIDATLRALRDFDRPQDRDGRLVCVFQPHQHSRTRHLLDEFASAFGEADIVIVPHIYFVRDSQAEMHKVSSTDLVNRLRQRGVRAMHLEPFGAIVEQLEPICRPGDTVAVMGAGPVWEIAHGFLAAGDITAAAREGSA
ncbi:MAG: cyanophycin synthetase, partial [Planctomycetota bacterium]